MLKRGNTSNIISDIFFMTGTECTKSLHYRLLNFFYVSYHNASIKLILPTKEKYKSMNSWFVSIATLVTSNLGERCLIKILMNISSESLRYYLESLKIYKGISSKKKTDLVELIVYGCITDKINKLGLQILQKKKPTKYWSKIR